MSQISIVCGARPSTLGRWARTALQLILPCAGALACAPELTEPADFAISGTWFAAGPAGGLTDVTIQLSQATDGAISGTFTATGTPGLQFCPPTPPCSLTGPLAGSNTVFQVFFEMEHAGRFTGQLTEASALHGAVERAGRVDPIEFLPVVIGQR